MSRNEITYETAIASIHSMFPSVEAATIEAVLDANSESERENVLYPLGVSGSFSSYTKRRCTTLAMRNPCLQMVL
jgi:hypothetical protein